MWDNVYFDHKCMLTKFLVMTKLVCRDYGYDCDFVIDGNNSDVIENFGQHMTDEHGVEYTKDALMQIILRKNGQV